MIRILSVRPGAVLALALAAAACRPTGVASTATAPVPAPAPARGPRPIPPGLAELGAHRVVPAPASVVPGSGAPFVLTATTAIVVSAGNPDAARVAEALAMQLRPATGLPLPVTVGSAAAPAGAISLRLGGPAALGPEGYALISSADSLSIVAAAPAGLFHGVQTLRQLLPAGIESEMRTRGAWRVPPGRIEDRPRFAWRGAMLDVARHFFSTDEVREFIDVLALYKLNILHLHLADDQGWRIQIDSWPKLTTVGGSTEVGGGPGGFYTKQEYAALVRYAQDRFVTIVPEIDMPGHTNAAIASYPELGCSKPTPAGDLGRMASGLYAGTSVGWSTFCPDSEVTYRFVDDIVREIGAMTPGQYFHIGGDEVNALTHAQYTHFVERVQDIVYKNGKIPIGWEEIGKARLRPTTLAQQWKSDSAILAVRQGARLVMSPSNKAYLDMKYDRSTELGLEWAGLIPLRTAYEWEPTTYLTGLTEQSIAGVEAPLWSETVQNITAANFLVMPRLPAIAEIGWSMPSARSWESFRSRIAAHGARWRLLGVSFFATPEVTWTPEVELLQ